MEVRHELCGIPIPGPPIAKTSMQNPPGRTIVTATTTSTNTTPVPADPPGGRTTTIVSTTPTTDAVTMAKRTAPAPPTTTTPVAITTGPIAIHFSTHVVTPPRQIAQKADTKTTNSVKGPIASTSTKTMMGKPNKQKPETKLLHQLMMSLTKPHKKK